jgi:WD40 repeat protein/tRNA A-37 threonylcarbamoyl transferase component Bud32
VQKRIGKFEVLDVLGTGGMGTVYKARDPILYRLVALKTVSAQLLANEDARVRFQREARAAARLQHPNIVTVYELGEADGAVYIAMELLAGMDLVEAMVPPERLSLTEKLRAVVQVCRGLDFAHKRGVIHRDVKPANVRLLPDGTIKIVDFGIARMGDSTVTQTGVVLGTPSYLAPEVLSTDRIDYRADMWSVGIILYELVTGRRPFQGPTFAALAYKIVHEPLPPIDAAALSLPAGLEELIARALAKEPARRFADLAEMAVTLERVLGVTPGSDVITPEARQRAATRSLDEARQLARRGDVDRALEAARRAQALAPDATGAADLVDELERRLPAEPAAAGPLPELDGTLVSEPTPSRRTPTGARRTPTPVLTEIRARGAAVFRELATFGEPPATQVAVVSPVKDVLAVAGADGAIRLWDLAARTRLAVLRTDIHRRAGHDARPLALAFSPDGMLLASGHVDGAIHVWDVARGEELMARPRHDQMVSCLAFSPSGQELASGGVDSVVKVWDLETARRGEARRRLMRQPATVTAIAYVAGGRLLLTGHSNRLLRLLDAESGRLVATLRGPEAPVNLLCPSPDGRLVAVGSQDRVLRVFDVEQRAAVAVLGAQRKAATSMCFFPDGEHLVTVALDNAVQLWHLRTPEPLASLWGPAAESFTGVTLYGGGDHMAVALADGRIRLWGPAGS